MTNFDPNLSSAGQAGSDGYVPASAAGETLTEAQISEILKENENLKKVVGSQGQELGELRNFNESLTPLFEKLDSRPELVRAILDDKIDSEMAKAALDNKLTIQEAELIQKAHEDVKNKMGDQKYEQASVEDIAKIVATEMEKYEQKFSKTLQEENEIRDFEKEVNEFISNTPDFVEYADEIDKWLDAHKSIVDISVAYDAVKGRKLSAEAGRRAGIESVEAAKRVAMNSAGGYSANNATVNDQSVIDQLIGGRHNPNIF